LIGNRLDIRAEFSEYIEDSRKALPSCAAHSYYLANGRRYPGLPQSIARPDAVIPSIFIAIDNQISVEKDQRLTPG
jgi:hypothetical protein